MRETVKQTLRQAGIDSGSPLVAAVSGGVDSLVLLHLLVDLSAEMGFRLSVCHVDHAMRTESADDASYVAELCHAWDVPFYSERVDVWARVRLTGESPEEAARNLRYEVLRRASQKQDDAKIALAHHMDDQAETVLIHLLRGAGTGGLGGMRSIRGDLIRPLLSFPKAMLEAYAAEHHIIPREDATNSDTAYLRNRIRLSLLPELETYQPQTVQSLGRLAQIVQADEDFLEEMTDAYQARMMHTEDGRCTIGRKDFREAPLAIRRRLVRRAVAHVLAREGGLSFAHSERLREMIDTAHAGSTCPLTSEGWLICTSGEAVFLRGAMAAPRKLAEHTIVLGGSTVLEEVGITIRAELTNTIEADADGVWFDAEKIALPLHVRARRDGDTIATRGAAGKKKLKKELIDCKIAVSERDMIPLVCDADDNILWVVGVRTANIAEPNKETKQYLYLRREKEI